MPADDMDNADDVTNPVRPRCRLPRLRQHRHLPLRPGQQPQLVPARQGQGLGQRSWPGPGRRRRDPGLRLLVRHGGADPRLCRLVGRGQRRIPGTAGRARGGPGATVPAAACSRNAADIRLAVDAVEDMFRLPDLIAWWSWPATPTTSRSRSLCKQLGRYVVGIGWPARQAGRWRQPAAISSSDALPGCRSSEAARNGREAQSAGTPNQSPRARPRITGPPPPPRCWAGAADRPGKGRRRLAAQLPAVKAQMKRMDPRRSRRVAGIQVVRRLPLRSRADVVELDEFDDPDGQAALSTSRPPGFSKLTVPGLIPGGARVSTTGA